jgi:hypothetical protein
MKKCFVISVDNSRESDRSRHGVIESLVNVRICVSPRGHTFVYAFNVLNGMLVMTL